MFPHETQYSQIQREGYKVTQNRVYTAKKHSKQNSHHMNAYVIIKSLKNQRQYIPESY